MAFHVDNKTAPLVKPLKQPVFSDVVRWFTDQLGQTPTIPQADWFNMVQSEILSLADALGVTPDKLDDNQLGKALKEVLKKINAATLENIGIVQLTNTIDDSEDKAITPKAVHTVKKKADQTPDALEDQLLIGNDDKSYRLIVASELTKLLSYMQTTGQAIDQAMSQKAITDVLKSKTAAFGTEQSTPTYSLHQTFGDNMAAALTAVPANCLITGAYSQQWPAAAIRYCPKIRAGGTL